MSYCLSINTYEGLVLCAASFLSASANTFSHSSMQRFTWPNNRFITLLSSGNQLTIDGVVNQIHQDLNEQMPVTLLTVNSLHEAADYIAAISVQLQKELIKKQGDAQAYDAYFIVSGQIANKKMETLLIDAQGNYIYESDATPFLQIGEIKFGKPILDRMIKRDIPLNTAAHCALVSVDSSIRSNPTAKMRIELLIYKNNQLETSHYLLLDENSDFFSNMSSAWDEGITSALEGLPHFDWEN